MKRLFHISDLHFGLEDRSALDWFARCVRVEHPAAVLITGDLTMRARSREFAAACDWIAALDVPVTVEVGNHDLPYFNPVARFFRPYARIRRIEGLVERELDLDGVAVVPLKTTARAQWRLDWSKGWVTRRALDRTLAAIDALPAGTDVLVTAHHPLVEAGTKGRALTRGGERALTELAARGVAAVLTGHVHDAFDLLKETSAGPIRMIGAGTLSKRLRSTPPGFNELTIASGRIDARVRNLEHVATPDMQIGAVPPDALPPRTPGEPVAPVGAVPPVDPPVR
ncbi:MULTISPECIES: metallophosphoesterase [unclassified Sphingopyxis]|uniref:metallophosphoesterase family protein n=1 Tax=unclassified Sphingopyxis TaxID=2614943 RepID=UPI000730C827|nr:MULTISPECIES: metallophosphoesterase [unclassified Sphingopyxis]KTE28231.1 metallophosphoesterase [Sphingopyxis sp. H057]KTE55387.1 metallophosphoesterase [Sphingopyxis sp. H073]KTE57722.1 metallophosphoesterase [Sphingopyxis sp. H071]KTE61041.1 metallophosphoesterase [Sphingopyxis sp. H107]KTE66274.1 metallophosphoesterase [Sphingopyxis sp. H100]